MMAKDNLLQQEVNDIRAVMAIKDALFVALVRRHPEAFDDILGNDELRPYADYIDRFKQGVIGN